MEGPMVVQCTGPTPALMRAWLLARLNHPLRDACQRRSVIRTLSVSCSYLRKLVVGRVPGDHPVPAGYCTTRHYPDPAGYSTLKCCRIRVTWATRSRKCNGDSKCRLRCSYVTTRNQWETALHWRQQLAIVKVTYYVLTGRAATRCVCLSDFYCHARRHFMKPENAEMLLFLKHILDFYWYWLRWTRLCM